MIKSIGLTIFSFILMEISYAQMPGTSGNPQIKYDDYLQKSRRQKTAAWILAGTGTALIASGMIISLGDVLEAIAGEPYNNTGEIIAIAGGACVAGSIPLFIAGSKNKKRANLSLSSQNIPVGFHRNQNLRYPSIGLRIGLGR